MLNKIILLIMLFPVASQAVYTKFKIKNAPFKKSYQFVEEFSDFKIDDLPTKDIGFSTGDCSKMVLSKDGKSIEYKDIEYISEIFSRSSKYDAIKMRVNGLEIKREVLYFELIKNCSEVSPYRFISNANQTYRGVHLKVGDRVYVENSPSATPIDAGLINKDGYLDKESLKRLTEQDKLKALKNNDFSDSRFNSVTRHRCIEVTRKREKLPTGVYKSEEGKFIAFNKVFEEKEVYTKPAGYGGNAHPSLYFGSILCLGNKKISDYKILCGNVAPLTSLSYSDRIQPNHKRIDALEAKYWRDERMRDRLECEKGIKEYEEKYNVKIPQSPFLTKEEKLLIKSGLDPDYEKWKQIKNKGL